MENAALTLALTLVSIISSLALIINWIGNRHIPGLQLIAVGFAIASLGNMLLGIQGAFSPVVTILLANAMILGGRIPIVMGLAQFWNQEKSRLPLLCTFWFIITMAAFYYFTVVVDDVLWRIRIYTAMMVIFSICNIYIIGFGLMKEREMRPVMALSSNFGAFLALMLFAFMGVTEFILMIVQSQTPLVDGQQSNSFLLLGSIFTSVVFAFAIIIMTMEELSVENKENAIFDPITTILNQRTFIEVGQRIMGVALRYSKPVSLLTIEVQNMEEVVKKHGYKVGNDMLRHFSMLASDRRRNEDVLARFSTKEFRMLLPGIDEAGAAIVTDKIKEMLANDEYEYRGVKIHVTLSIATITKREEDLDLQQMLHEGEIELYRIKQESGLLG